MATKGIISTRDKLKKLLQKDPTITCGDAAKRLGVSKQRISQLAGKTGFRKTVEWKRDG